MELWKQVAINDLKRFSCLEDSIKSITEKIEAINAKMEGSAFSFGSIPVQGGASTQEDKLNNCIVEKDKLKKQRKINNLEYEAVKRALNRLTQDQRIILEYAYIARTQDHIAKIMARFNVEKTRAYELKEEALSCFVMVMYGE